MRKLLIVLAISLFSFSAVRAQDVSGIIKVNPLGMAFGVFNATYEKPLNEKSSVTVGASYFNWSALRISGMGGRLGYRFYLGNNTTSPEGLFVSPVLDLNSYSYSYRDEDPNTGEWITRKESVFSVGGGVQGGYQWVWDSGVALDLFFGYGYRAAKFESYDYSGGYPMLGLAVGYAFQ